MTHKTLVINLLIIFVLSACKSNAETFQPTSTATPTIQATSTLIITPTSSIWKPTFTPAPSEISGQVVFTYWAYPEADFKQIFLFTLEEREIKQLTFSGANYDPTWSPDGKLIAFTSNRDKKFNIYVMDKNGNNEKQITDFEEGASSPAWSPSGEELAFVSNHEGKIGIFIKNLVTGETNWLTYGLSPKWSPNGEKILFQRDYYILEINADGTNEKQLTQEPVLASTLEWCSDLTCIIYEIAKGVDTPTYLSVINIETGTEKKLFNGVTELRNFQYGLSKSPQSGLLIFSNGLLLYAFDMEINRLYSLGIQGTDASLFP